MTADTREIVTKLKHKVAGLQEDIDMLALMEELQDIYNLFNDKLKEDGQKESNPHTEELRKVLKIILTDRTADYIATSQQLDSLGWFASNEYLCIALRINNIKQVNLTEENICSYIENTIPHSCSFTHRNYVVAFVNTTVSQLELEDIAERLGYFVRDSHFKAGYSRIMTGHFNLRRQYLQARIALDMGHQKNPSGYNHLFNDVVFDYILRQSTRKLPGYMLCHEKLLHLKELDEFQNTEYMNTLKLYLNNHLNAVQTAKDLYIHRSTFLYRLDKIKDLLDTTLEDPEEILYLMLSFRFLEMERQEDRGHSN